MAAVPTQKYITVSAAGARWEGAGLHRHRSSWLGSVPSGCPEPRSRCQRGLAAVQRRRPAPDMLLGRGGHGPHGAGGQRLIHPREKRERKGKMKSSPVPSGTKGKGERVRGRQPQGSEDAGERVRGQAGRGGPRQRQCGRSLAQRGLPLTLRGADVLPQHFSSYPVNKGIRRSQLTCEVPAGSRPHQIP